MADERLDPKTSSISNVQRHIARYNVALQYCQNVDVLDIACGTGYGTHLISEVANRAVGVDIDKETIDKARSDHPAQNISFYDGDFFDYDGKFDTVVCFETLEHLDDLEKAQNKALEWLKPGGILIFSVPLNEEPGFNEHHKHRFSVADARNLFINMRFMGELLQVGINLFQVDESWNKNRSYYIGVRKLD